MAYRAFRYLLESIAKPILELVHGRGIRGEEIDIAIFAVDGRTQHVLHRTAKQVNAGIVHEIVEQLLMVEQNVVTAPLLRRKIPTGQAQGFGNENDTSMARTQPFEVNAVE